MTSVPPQPFPSLKILGGRVDAVTVPQILELAESQIAGGHFLQIITVNALMLLETEKDSELQKIFSEASVVVADSIGISWSASLKRFRLPERIPGIDLMIFLCQLAERKSWPIFLIGAKPGVAEQVKLNLEKQLPRLKICGAAHGYFDDTEEKAILAEVDRHKPRLIFVGLNIPFQEIWIYRRLRQFPGLCVMGVGGSFDVLSGRLKRAPRWIQKIGLEWFFRFIQEPWRWKRIVRIPSLFYKIIFSSNH